MKSYRLRVTPTCVSDLRWWAWSRWAAAAAFSWLAFRCLDVVFAVSDDVRLDVEMSQEERAKRLPWW